METKKWIRLCEVTIGIFTVNAFLFVHSICTNIVKHGMQEPEGVHGQLEGCNKHLLVRVFNGKDVL